MGKHLGRLRSRCICAIIRSKLPRISIRDIEGNVHELRGHTKAARREPANLLE